MYKSRYGFKGSRPRHEMLETVESSIEKHLQPPELEFQTLQIPYDVRDRHIYAIGKTRNGKTTLLYSIIEQDINNDAGICVLDPKPSGQKPNLVETVLQHIPSRRAKDVIYFSAANPIPIDVMSWKTQAERQTLAADLMTTFMHYQTQKDGDRWPGILRHVIHALLDAQGCSFLDINEFLIDEDFRNRTLKRVTRPYLLKYWKDAFPLYDKKAPEPILHRVSTFLLVPPLNVMLSPSERGLKIEDVIRDRKILLVDLTGAGQETANFIGTLFVSRIQQAVYRDLGQNFYLFADEFQNFQTSAFDKILSEAGGLGLRLTLANQYLDQMEPKIRNAVRGNVQTHFVFQIAPEDCSAFKNIMPMSDAVPGPVKPDVLANLPPFTALYAIAGQDPQFKKIPPPPPPPTKEQLERAQEIKDNTLRDYPPDTGKAPPKSHASGKGKPEPEGTVL